MLLPTPEGVLHAKFEIPSSKTVTCSLWTDKQMDQLGWVTRKNTRGGNGGGGGGDASPVGVRTPLWLPNHFVI